MFYATPILIVYNVQHSVIDVKPSSARNGSMFDVPGCRKWAVLEIGCCAKVTHSRLSSCHFFESLEGSKVQGVNVDVGRLIFRSFGSKFVQKFASAS